jgi:Na+-transporting NADH:ubiquinone oxidoreductase subunit C
MEFTPQKTVLIAGVICFACSIFVATSAVGLKDLQDANEKLDRQKKVLDVAGLLDAKIAQDPAAIQTQYDDRIQPELLSLKKDGKGCDGLNVDGFNQQKIAKDPATSVKAEANKAKVLNVPNCAMIFKVRAEKGSEKIETIILPVEGKGLWSTLYGYLALDPTGVDVKGLTFYKHAETPGLGGEVDNPKWKQQWSGKKAFVQGDDTPKLYVKKGQANDAYSVDGLSGATLTSNGVTNLLQFWLGEQGFGPYLKSQRK